MAKKMRLEVADKKTIARYALSGKRMHSIECIHKRSEALLERKRPHPGLWLS